MNTRSLAIPLILLGVLFSRCDLGTSPPPVQEAFLFRVTVKDQAGNPVPNLRVSVTPPFDLAPLQKPSPGPSASGITASSTVNFEVAAPARVNLFLNEMDGTTIQKLMENRFVNPGVYAVRLSLQGHDGARVMVCRLAAVDTATGNSVFRDSIFVTLWQPDFQVAYLGFTSAAGMFESRDTLSFPYVLTLPPIVITRNDPTPLGSLSFPDSCMITLMDTAQGTHMTFGRRLVRGLNDIAVTWDPVGSTGPANAALPPAEPTTLSPVTRDAFVWRLYQNYPNPFN